VSTECIKTIQYHILMTPIKCTYNQFCHITVKNCYTLLHVSTISRHHQKKSYKRWIKHLYMSSFRIWVDACTKLNQHPKRTVEYWLKLGELKVTKLYLTFTYKIAIQYNICAFKHLLQFLEPGCVNTVPLNLNDDISCLSEQTLQTSCVSLSSWWRPWKDRNR